MMYIAKKFEPEPDITAHELALIVKKWGSALRTGLRLDEKAWDEMPKGMGRHFK